MSVQKMIVVVALVGSCLVTGGLNAQPPMPKLLLAEPFPDDPGQWSDLSDVQADELTRRNLTRIMWAVHAYSADHENQLPPAVVPNENLPAKKRLSGFVLLLPYFGKRPDYLPADDLRWNAWKVDEKSLVDLYKSIDLTKAWDDPVNLPAAKTVVPYFLTTLGKFRTDEGYGVSHFAMVRGGVGEGGSGLDNGGFPRTGIDKPLTYKDIVDGTVDTLAIGQISDQLGPWIAAGSSTIRHAVWNSTDPQQPGFAGPVDEGGYFATLDGWVDFIDVKALGEKDFQSIAGRRDKTLVMDLRSHRFPTMQAWKQK